MPLRGIIIDESFSYRIMPKCSHVVLLIIASNILTLSIYSSVKFDYNSIVSSVSSPSWSQPLPQPFQYSKIQTGKYTPSTYFEKVCENLYICFFALQDESFNHWMRINRKNFQHLFQVTILPKMWNNYLQNEKLILITHAKSRKAIRLNLLSMIRVIY